MSFVLCFLIGLIGADAPKDTGKTDTSKSGTIESSSSKKSNGTKHNAVFVGKITNLSNNPGSQITFQVTGQVVTQGKTIHHRINVPTGRGRHHTMTVNEPSYQIKNVTKTMSYVPHKDLLVKKLLSVKKGKQTWAEGEFSDLKKGGGCIVK